MNKPLLNGLSITLSMAQMSINTGLLQGFGVCEHSLAPTTCVSHSAELFTQRLPHQQRVFVRLAENQAVERMLVRAQRVDGGTAVVDDAVQQAEFGGRTPRGAHADVDADFRQALLPPDVTQFGLQLLGAGLCVTAHRQTAEAHLNLKRRTSTEMKGLN